MAKSLHLNLRFPAQQVALFRILLENLKLDEEGNPAEYPLGVEIVYEEECEAGPLFPAGVAFDLWFDEPRSAYYFALRLQEAREAWATFALPAVQPPSRAAGQVEALIRPEWLAHYQSAIQSVQVVLGPESLTLVLAEGLHGGQNVRLTLAYEEPRALLMLGELAGQRAENATWSATVRRQQEGGVAGG